MTQDVFIISAKRTAIGSLMGQYNTLAAHQLGAVAIKAAMDATSIATDQVDEVLMGCVLPAGQGQAPARQASLGAGLPLSAGCTTVNKVCGSGMKTIMLGCDAIKSESAEVVVAGGMESMTNAPYLMPGARQGYRMGSREILDHMFYDGLRNPYDDQMMGVFAELCADSKEFSREQQDELTARSVVNSKQAIEQGLFKQEIAPVTVSSRRGDSVFDTDEEPGRMNVEKIPTLRPAFKRDGGTVTAANSSKISDGAAAVVLAGADFVSKHDVQPMAKIVAHATHAHQPEWFTTAPVGAMQKVLEKANWSVEDVDLWEINEAFAVVALAAIKELNLDVEKVNVHGGACAMGHPIGASGSRIVVTLIHALKQRGLKRGVASLCIGGGEATALAIELV